MVSAIGVVLVAVSYQSLSVAVCAGARSKIVRFCSLQNDTVLLGASVTGVSSV